jgi:Terminase small subunit
MSLPASIKPLEGKQLAFVVEYMKAKNGTQAAIRAGYSVKTAASIGGENLRKPAIAAAIKTLLDEYKRSAGIETVALLEIAKWGSLTDIRGAFNDHGGIRRPPLWSRELACAINSPMPAARPSARRSGSGLAGAGPEAAGAHPAAGAIHRGCAPF